MTPSTQVLADGGILSLWDRWLDAEQEKTLFDHLATTVPWRQDKIRMMGREIDQPRLTAAFADPGVKYKYSGLTLTPNPWTPELATLKARVEEVTGARFNYVLGNFYRQGTDSIGFHADDEPELGPDPTIASLSLGATRRFVLKHQRTPQPSVGLDLAGGALLVMGGTLQRNWYHGVPKTARPVGPRINLTFRLIRS